MKKLIGSLLILFSLTASADTKISQLPLNSAASTHSNDSFPYVNSVANATQRLTLGDLPNLPSLQTVFSTLVPSQVGQNGKCLQSNGTITLWGTCTTGAVTSVGLFDGSTIPIYTITHSPVTSTGTLTFTLLTELANTVFAGPTTGAASQPTFRSLVGADLPNPSASTLGGVESLAALSHNFLTSISTSGVPTQAQPAFTDVSGTATETQGGTNQTTYALGDTLYSSAADTLSKLSGNTTSTKKYLSQTGTGTVSAAPSWLQPACGDLSNGAASCSTDTTNASNISSGTLGAARLPNPTSSTLGGVESLAAVSHNFLTSISTSGVPTQAQPVCADLSNAAASCSTDATNASNISSGTLGASRLPNPTSSTLGGVESYAAVSNQWINAISTSGVPSSTQPSCSNLSNAATSCSTDTTNASNISSGTLPAARLPNPTSSTLGGVESLASASHQFLTSISTSGVPAQAQPAFTDISGTALETQGGTNQTTYALGDTLYSSAANTLSKLSGNTTSTKKFLAQTGTGTVSAAPSWLQPACGDLSNGATSCSTDTTNASNISSGTLGAARLPNPTSSTLGGVESLAAISHNFLTSISTSGVPAQAQPVCADLSNAATSCSTDTTNASNISSGTLGAARLPNPTSSTLGGVESLAAVSHNFLTSISTSGVPTQAQPAFTDISGSVAASQLPNPSSSTLGGIQSYAAVSNQWINAISTSGVPSSTQPAFTNISGTAQTSQGGTGVTSVTTSPTASSFAGWDANSNLAANNLLDGYATTATAAATTTLTISSASQQYFTGSTTQTVKLPVASTLALGTQYIITNLSSGAVTVQSSGSNTLQAMAQNTQLTATSIATSGTGTAAWNWGYSAVQNSLSGGGSVTSVTFTGDGTVLSSTPSSAVTSSGTLTAAIKTQTARTFLQGPTSGSAAAPTFAALTVPTIQRFTSGSGTYTTPTNPAPLYIIVDLIGGGGGGASSGSSPNNGSAGSNTTFGSSFLTAGGGAGARAGLDTAGTGGTNTVNAGGTTLINAVGGGGGAAGSTVVTTTALGGMPGGSSCVGGGGAGGTASDSAGTGGAGAANTGGGGGGAGQGADASSRSGGGGGSGGCLKIMITSISATYAYAVGGGGAGGTAGNQVGGAGGSGVVTVTEFYQ